MLSPCFPAGEVVSLGVEIGSGGNCSEELTMNRRNQEEGRFRVLLIGIGDHTKEKREAFCRKVSENYSISVSLLEKIVDRCPIVLKKNLSRKTAETLTKALHSFGATVAVEEKRDALNITLEFEGMGLPQLALESSSFRKTPTGGRMITGRVRNVSTETLDDTQVLIQLFDDFEELITFEVIPLPIQPLPSGAASPFKAEVERSLSIKRVSIGFKRASGTPLTALDRRNKQEWVEVDLEEETGNPSSRLPSSESQAGKSSPQSVDLTPVVLIEEDLDVKEDSPPSLEGGDTQQTVEEEEREEEKDEGSFLLNFENALWKPFSHSERDLDLSSTDPEMGEKGEEEWEILLEEDDGSSSTPSLSAPEMGSGVLSAEKGDASFREALSERALSGATDVRETPESVKGNSDSDEWKETEHASFPWIEDFRKAVEIYYKEPPDIFPGWFESQRKENGFADSFHSLLTILVHARFDQMSQSENALENTARVFKIIHDPHLKLEEIPPLEGTQFFSGENWRDLLYRAIPKLQQVSKSILERKEWSGPSMERLIQIIPHMSEKNSRKGVRWINLLLPDIVKIDFSNTPILVGESLYRVASRLGVVDPSFDPYEGKNSMGEIKIQSFAVAAFPQFPLRVEEPMTWEGSKEEGGHCTPVQPQCEDCLFGPLCPRLCLHFNPSAKGMRSGQSVSLGG
jgi:ribosomal protein L7/L12